MHGSTPSVRARRRPPGSSGQAPAGIGTRVRPLRPKGRGEGLCASRAVGVSGHCRRSIGPRDLLRLHTSAACAYICCMATVRIPQSMAEQIDRLRGDVPRDRFVRRMLEKALENPQAKGGTPERRLPTGDSAPASVPSRASARGVAERGSDARTASFRSASSARQVPAGPQASPPSDVSSSASQGREGEAGSSGGAGAAPEETEALKALAITGAGLPAQTTVEEMLASCPNCAGDFLRVDGIERCEDCGTPRAVE
jgi:hypothetical protein